MELGLNIGDILQLEPVQSEGRYRVSLIGLVPGRSLLVLAPEVGGRLVFVREGQGFKVRAFAGKDILVFTTQVQRSCTQPYAYLHLRYPEKLEQIPVRRVRRLRIKLEGRLEVPGVAGAPSTPHRVSIQDLSVSGALVWADSPLGELGTTAVLQFALDFPGLPTRSVELAAEIRSAATAGPETRWRHGVQFRALDEVTALALRAFVYEKLSEGG